MRENFEIRIREFDKLKKGWNDGNGETFSHDLIELAVQLAKRYFKTYNLSVSGMPCENGSIDLVFNKNDHFMDMNISPNSSSTTLTYCKGIGKNKIEENWGTVEIKKLDVIFKKFNEITKS